jgi:hypothetical protein
MIWNKFCNEKLTITLCRPMSITRFPVSFTVFYINKLSKCNRIVTLCIYSLTCRILIFKAVVMISSIFWDITPCRPWKNNRCFGGTYLLHLESWRISQARSQHEAGSKLPGGDMFLTKVSWFSTGYMALYLPPPPKVELFIFSPVNSSFTFVKPKVHYKNKFIQFWNTSNILSSVTAAPKWHNYFSC